MSGVEGDWSNLRHSSLRSEIVTFPLELNMDIIGVTASTIRQVTDNS